MAVPFPMTLSVRTCHLELPTSAHVFPLSSIKARRSFSPADVMRYRSQISHFDSISPFLFRNRVSIGSGQEGQKIGEHSSCARVKSGNSLAELDSLGSPTEAEYSIRGSRRFDLGFKNGLENFEDKNIETAHEFGYDLPKITSSDVITCWKQCPFPKPSYRGLHGRDLLVADLVALKAYADYASSWLKSWQVPLRSSYDHASIANYFNRRPHVMVFRILEVSAALGFFSLQKLAQQVFPTVYMPGLTPEERNRQSTVAIARKLKLTLVRLGPTFVKVAQSLSARPDVIGLDTAKVLAELQDQLPPFPTKEAMSVIEEEFGVPWSEAFSHISDQPVAAASFGQVYRGWTLEGQEVAVKVQRPDLLFSVARDMYILRLGLALVRKVAGMNTDISVLADELGQGLFGELDYTLEAANADEFRSLHTGLSFVKVPNMLHHLTRRRVLTMEWIHGDRPADLQRIAQGLLLDGGAASTSQQLDAKCRLISMVKKGVESSLVQLYETGLLHADPHPGNILFTPDGSLCYLDFGLLCRMNKKHQIAMFAAIAHLVNGEWQSLVDDLADMDILKPTMDRFLVRLALERAFGEGPDAIVQDGVPDLKFGQITGKFWQIALKFRFRLPPYYTLVLRSLASLEGIALLVDPDFKIFASAYPYVIQRLLTENSAPTRRVLQSLLLTESKEFRWSRMGSIIRFSRKASPFSSVTGNESSSSRKGEDLTQTLLRLALSKEGVGVRRVLLEANTESLAICFVSSKARNFRQKLVTVMADALYSFALEQAIPRFLPVGRDFHGDALSDMDGTKPGFGNGFDSKKREVISSTPEHADSVDSIRVTRKSVAEVPLFKNHIFWFFIRVFAERLRSTPLLFIRTGLAVLTILGCAVGLCFHRLAVTFSNRWIAAGDTLSEPMGISCYPLSAS